MAWRQHTNYHGGREYDLDPPSDIAFGNVRLTVAWILYTGRFQLERLLKRARPASKVMSPDKVYREGFTILGSANDRLSSHGAGSAPYPFPEPGDPRNRRNARSRVQ